MKIESELQIVELLNKYFPNLELIKQNEKCIYDGIVREFSCPCIVSIRIRFNLLEILNQGEIEERDFVKIIEKILRNKENWSKISFPCSDDIVDKAKNKCRFESSLCPKNN